MSRPNSQPESSGGISVGIVRGANVSHFAGRATLTNLFWLSPKHQPIPGVTTDKKGEVIALDTSKARAAGVQSAEMAGREP